MELSDAAKLAGDFCAEKDLKISLSFQMPPGYETANGTFDPVKKTLFLNEEVLRGVPEYEAAFYLFHELRHAEQYQHPERFDETIRRSLPYVVLYDGTCYRLNRGGWQECCLSGEEDFADIYLGLPYEVDANEYAYARVRSLCGDSEELGKLRDFWRPKRRRPEEVYQRLFQRIDEAIESARSRASAPRCANDTGGDSNG